LPAFKFDHSLYFKTSVAICKAKILAIHMEELGNDAYTGINYSRKSFSSPSLPYQSRVLFCRHFCFKSGFIHSYQLTGVQQCQNTVMWSQYHLYFSYKLSYFFIHLVICAHRTPRAVNIPHFTLFPLPAASSDLSVKCRVFFFECEW